MNLQEKHILNKKTFFKNTFIIYCKFLKEN